MLPVLGKKAVLEWCMKEGLIGSSYVFPKCGKSIELRERTVDTGSQVTLMKESVWNQLGSPSLINSGSILTGFGLSKTHVIGSFNSTVSIDNQDIPVKINVVSSTTQ
ncbi:hypothetical protein TNCV_493581 [Trichonephila clavipes]|nr:hypothetical protein TNCV_493581 [Trichonephila clavipes]